MIIPNYIILSSNSLFGSVCDACSLLPSIMWIRKGRRARRRERDICRICTVVSVSDFNEDELSGFPFHVVLGPFCAHHTTWYTAAPYGSLPSVYGIFILSCTLLARSVAGCWGGVGGRLDVTALWCDQMACHGRIFSLFFSLPHRSKFLTELCYVLPPYLFIWRFRPNNCTKIN